MLGKATSVMAAGALAAAGLLAWSTPAAAETAPQAAAAVPNCVETDLDASGWTDELEVINDCSYSVRVKVVLAYETDLACQTIPSGYTAHYSWGYPGRFDGLVDC
ncbi:hypothetical protein [Nocardiopsis aegyptia]|uniref:Alpha amylase inhibitor n=1 Tax=Nocardiopsis aegyptia TaxID=220378 RepID=A0A7Z0EHI7_9ACTN|nr:hypothetical protein [Nocardiopsis aegyptia]NYJ32197.1 hypothetical protein [Nocardiopsis aegyptia]